MEREILMQARSLTSLQHPLVKHYGMPIQHLALTKAHQQVEGNHRAAAWSAILDGVKPTGRGTVVRAMQEALTSWLCYRDAVAEICGVDCSSHDYKTAVA